MRLLAHGATGCLLHYRAESCLTNGAALMRRRATAKDDDECGGGKLFRRRGGCSERGIADPVTFRRLLAERSKLVKNDDAE